MASSGKKMDRPALAGSFGAGWAGGSVKSTVPRAGKLSDSSDSFGSNRVEAIACRICMLYSTTLKQDMRPTKFFFDDNTKYACLLAEAETIFASRSRNNVC